MTWAAKVGSSVAGGLILGPGAATVLVEGEAQSLVGDAVNPHGSGAHGLPFMAQGSTSVLVEGLPPCRVGDLATCGHAVANGSPTTMIGG